MARLRNWLDSITAYRPVTQGRPWYFYEQIEAYLGPSGPGGYPLSYGKKYCRLFYEAPRLANSVAGRRWVRRTMILLQEAIKDFIVERFRRGTLGTMQPSELTQAAFDSHPTAYAWGGLTVVALLSPALLYDILAIAREEFSPLRRHFRATLRQTVVTGALVLRHAITLLVRWRRSGAWH